jgi:1-deoxy-D-xylulose-5-phosphate reductoisomerase
MVKKKIAILGSTGSIGKTTFDILKKNKNKFEVILLTSNNNINELIKQAKFFKVKNLVINNQEHYLTLKKIYKNKKVRIYNDINNLPKIINKKIDYTMCSISGLDGLKPTLDAIKFSKIVAIANKESLICGWRLIEKELKRNSTKFIPVDSEHYSIWSLLNGSNINNIEQVVITASGGPFLNFSKKKLKIVKPNSAVKHPNWKMGRKISVDSSTLMNKVFEVIEAQRIFNIELNKFTVLTHPKSYVHAIVKLNNGLTKILVHDTNMRIPITNSIFNDKNIKVNSKKLDINILNNLKLKKIDKLKFPSMKILKMVPNKNSLFETIIVSANDQLVHFFLNKQISFLDIVNKLSKILKLKEFKKYKHIYPKNFTQIKKLNEYVRLKVNSLCI